MNNLIESTWKCVGSAWLLTLWGAVATAQTQIGNDIQGEAANDRFGTSVSYSADGTIVAIGAPGNDGNGGASGHVRVFEYDGNDWVQLGADIDGG